MSKEVSFGKVKIVSVEATKNPEWVRVGFTQEVTTTYTPDPNNSRADGLGFMNMFGDPMEPRVYQDTRKCYENVKTSVLEKNDWKEGSEITGIRISLFAHDIALSDNHAASQDGKFYSTRIMPENAPARIEVPVEESRKIYEAWKAAKAAQNTVSEQVAQPTPTVTGPVAD